MHKLYNYHTLIIINDNDLKKNQTDAIQNIDLLLDRLARLSADSHWAHRASGIRGAILRARLQVKQGEAVGQKDELWELVDQGFLILKRAASEIPDSGNK
jgi:hypothetical protein